MKAEFNGIRSDCRASYPDIPGDVLDDIIMRTYGMMAKTFSPQEQSARSEGPSATMSRIAEKKLEQLGGDVCGVLVRKDGKLAAVDEHGRVQWLRKAEEAEEAEEAEAKGRVLIAMCRDLKARVADMEAAHPQPAQQGSVPEAKEIIDRVIEELENGFVRCERCGDQEDAATLDCMSDLKRLQSLLTVTHSDNGEQGGEWIKCSERLPAEADADCDGCLWVCWYDKRWRMDREHIKSIDCEYFAWKPTGLKRPQPPKEGEGDE